MADMDITIDDGTQRALIFRAINSEIVLLKKLYQREDGKYFPPSIKYQVKLLQEVNEEKLYPELFFSLRDMESQRAALEDELLLSSEEEELHNMMAGGDTAD